MDIRQLCRCTHHIWPNLLKAIIPLEHNLKPDKYSSELDHVKLSKTKQFTLGECLSGEVKTYAELN